MRNFCDLDELAQGRHQLRRARKDIQDSIPAITPRIAVHGNGRYRVDGVV